MADRTVRVTLAAQVSNYVQGMEQAARATRETGTAAEQLSQQGDAIKELSSTAGPALLGIGALAATGVGLAVSKFAEFDQAMSEVQASTHETSGNMELLRQAALKAGADTVFSAKEAAEAENELAKAGVSTADVLGGALTGAMSLASAGGLEVGAAAEIAATAMTQFSLSGDKVPHIADLLAAGAGKAQGSVEDLSNALNQGGLVAAQAGFSIEETTGTLAAFAAAGLVGSDAGTSLKTAILALEKPSTTAQAALDEYGITVYDAQGKMLSFSGIADQLKTKLGGLTDEQRNSALATIFGTDAVRAASVLYKQGASGIEDWTAKVDDSGYAAETARLKLDNLNGDLEYLGGSIDTALIQSGSAANGVLRDLVQTTTGLVDGIGSLPGPVLAIGLAFTVVVAAVGLLGGGFITLVPKIAATRLAMSELNLTAGRLGKMLGVGGAVGIGVAVAVAGLSNLGATADLTSDQLSKLDTALKLGDASNLDELFKQSADSTKGFSDQLDNLYSGDFFKSQDRTLGLNNFVKAITGSDIYPELARIDAQFKAIDSSLAGLVKDNMPEAVEQFNKLREAAGDSPEKIAELDQATSGYGAALRDLATQQGITLSDTELLALKQGEGAAAQQLLADTSEPAKVGLEQIGEAAEDTGQQVSDLSDSIKNFGSAQFDVEQSTNAFQSALADLKVNLDEGKGSLDQTTEAGRATSGALLDTASNANALAAAQLAAGASSDVVKATLDNGRQAIISTRTALGESADEAARYADRLIATPENVQTQVNLIGVSAAQQTIDNFIANNSQKRVNIAVGIGGSGGLTPYAEGGAVRGPGTTISDSIPALLSNGEHVLTAREVMLMGGQAAVYGFRQSLKAKPQGYANGGAVASNYAYATRTYSSGSAAASQQVVQNYYNFPEVGPYDPNTAIDIVARDFARRS